MTACSMGSLRGGRTTAATPTRPNMKWFIQWADKFTGHTHPYHRARKGASTRLRRGAEPEGLAGCCLVIGVGDDRIAIVLQQDGF